MGLQEVFINNLRRIRKQKNITQEKLAELCQTDTSYIGQIEIGKRFPSISLIEKMAKALGTPAYLFFMESIQDNLSTQVNEQTLKEISNNINNYVLHELKKLEQK